MTGYAEKSGLEALEKRVEKLEEALAKALKKIKKLEGRVGAIDTD